jgi:hypothetical protein
VVGRGGSGRRIVGGRVGTTSVALSSTVASGALLTLGVDGEVVEVVVVVAAAGGGAGSGFLSNGAEAARTLVGRGTGRGGGTKFVASSESVSASPALVLLLLLESVSNNTRAFSAERRGELPTHALGDLAPDRGDLLGGDDERRSLPLSSSSSESDLSNTQLLLDFGRDSLIMSRNYTIEACD